jgi:hypothetical protein
VEDHEISILLNEFSVSVEVMQELAKDFFGKREEISSFKVVAVQ